MNVPAKEYPVTTTFDAGAAAPLPTSVPAPMSGVPGAPSAGPVMAPPDMAQPEWAPVPTTMGWPPPAVDPRWPQGPGMSPASPQAPALGATWPQAPVGSAAKRRSGAERTVDLVLRLSLVVAVAGVAFAVGRETAPRSAATTAGGTGSARGGFGAGTGTGTTGSGTGSGNGQNAVVAPPASAAPNAVGQQQAAASVAPAASGAPTGAGTGTVTLPGLPQGGDDQGGGRGFGGRGGLTGTVTAVGDGTISFTTASGQTTDVATTDTTTYHQQTPATAADVVVGSSVRITAQGGFGGGFGDRPGQGAPAASAAPGAVVASTTPTATDVQILPASDAGSGAASIGQGRGFGRGGLTGTVSAIGDGTISFSTAGGQTIDIATTPTTTYHGETAATAADVVAGSSIRITAAGGFGGGFGVGQPGVPAASAGTASGPSAAAITASDVEVLLPAGQ